MSEDRASRRSEERAKAGAGLSLDIGSDGVAVLEFDEPDGEHNRFTPELLERFGALVSEVRSRADEGEVRGLVITSGKPDSFIVGMDVETIAEIGTAAAGTTGAREGQLAFEALAELHVPTVAAVNGTCLGGATEMILACDWRLAADSRAVEIGLPEINLGIIPGFGGTQRLPRTISLERALPMILSGSSVHAAKALRIGLVDALVPTPLLLQEARRWAAGEASPPASAANGGARRRAPEDRSWGRRLRRAALEGNLVGRALVFRRAARGVRDRTGGHYPAPEKALQAVRRGSGMPLGDALRLEADLVGELVVSDVAHNLMGIFFLRQAARRARYGVAGAAPRHVGKVGVLGAGVMGGGIAQLAAYQQIPVRLKDIELGPLQSAMAVAHRRFRERRRRGRLQEREVGQRMGLIAPTTEYTGFRQSDLVVEAVVEDLGIKHQVLAATEAAAGPETVIATNTSSLTLAALGTALDDPGRLVGLHFFNPVHKMQLVEVVRGPQTRPEVLATAAALAVRLGKVPVIVADAPGFFVNRVLMPYLNEGLLLVQEGNAIAAVDEALEDWGMPMGPLRLLDEIGLDVASKVADELGSVFGDRVPAATGLQRIAESGRKGRKGGRGFYRYDGDDPSPDREAQRLLAGRSRGRADDDEIVDRCIGMMLNEACEALGAGVVGSPGEGDLAMVLGTGFAPFRGGIFRWADTYGLGSVIERMERLAAAHGDRFAPAATLRAATDGGFYPEDWPRKVEFS